MPRISSLGLNETGTDGNSAGRINGVVCGIVTNNEDPERIGRVKVKFPWLSDEHESDWARISSPMAGSERGFTTIPEVEDEVLVAFEHGDINRPYVVGGLWNKKDKPPFDNADGKNDTRMWKSRSGSIIQMGDKDGEVSITLRTASGNVEVLLDDKEPACKITVKGGPIVYETDGATTIKSGGDMTIESGGNLDISAKGNIKIDATGNLDAKATGNFTGKSTGNATVEGTGMTKIKGTSVSIDGGPMVEIKGGIVKLN